MAGQRNVVVLIFDTLRPDYLGCYGGDQDTPSFDAAADQGVRFENAFSTAPGTPISHASMYTGQYPSDHGVTGQYIDLPKDTPVLADWFRQAGYDTFGITGPSKMGSDWGYDRGFDELFEPYYDLPAPTSWRNLTRSVVDGRFRRYFRRQLTRGGREKTRFKFDLLEDRIRSELDRPFFALCNFTTVHGPYDPPRPYRQARRPDYTRPRTFLQQYLQDDPGTIDHPDIRMDRVASMGTGEGVGRYLADPSYLTDAEVELLRDWYAASVAYLDDELARFLAFYERELADDTVLVLTADHGEQLGERGLWEHSYYLYDETLHVPLVVVGPDLPAERRSELASHVDVFPTLCALAGVDQPGTTAGSSLFDGSERSAVFMEYGARDVDAMAAESAHGRHLDRDRCRELAAGRKAVRTTEYQFEVDSTGAERLLAIPGQTELVDPDTEVLDRLRDRLHETLGDTFGVWPEGDPADVQLNQRVEANLRELGYIS
jgi:arylsulfatase A-like enzyme